VNGNRQGHHFSKLVRAEHDWHDRAVAPLIANFCIDFAISAFALK